MKLAIVILNWNGLALLKRYLPGVINTSGEALVYLADNASTDGSVEYVSEAFPEVEIVINPTNEGFAKGYNSALANIEADIYCLLNSDVEVTNGWITPVMELLKSRPEIAIVQPKILDLLNPEYFEYAGAGGGFLDQLGYPFCRGRVFQTLEKDKGQYNDTVEIFWATGACMFIRREVFNELGGFDADYFAHQEEIDLCWRARNMGYNVYYTGKSTVYHLGGSTLSNMNPKKTYLNFRNSLFSITKNLPKRKALPIVLARLVLDLIAGIRFVLQLKLEHFTAILRAHLSFYRHLPQMLRKRPGKNYVASYYIATSIVWSYYVLQKRKYKELVKD